MQRAALLYVSALVAIFTIILFVGAGHPDEIVVAKQAADAAVVDEMADILDAPQRVRPPRLKDHYSFAGEDVPVDDYDVRDRLDREIITNTFYHSSTQWILKHKARYFPTIERILREEGVPEDLKYIAVAESALKDFRSPAGAAGVWHFMPATGREYGLEVNGEVDERYHLEKSTRAAAKFMKQLHGQLDSWTLAAAAYNRGLGGVRSKKNAQLGETYYDLFLNEETSRYVFRIIALKDIIEDPKYYGFFLDPEDYDTLPYTSTPMTVTESISDLPAFAQKYGTSYRKLKVLNPWLKDTKLTISKGNSYVLEIPQ